MFELKVALNYLVPRKRYLSVSLISTISLFVIAVVVWLTIVFFSATLGLEKRWTEKLIALTAPVRVVPTNNYWNSYYTLIDTVSQSSNFSQKSIDEKLKSSRTNPYDPNVDGQLPLSFPKPYVDDAGQCIDLVKEAYKAASTAKTAQNCFVNPFEVAYATASLTLLREREGNMTTRMVTQPSYVTNFTPEKLALEKSFLPLSRADLENIPHQDSSLRIQKEKDRLLLPENTPYGSAVILPKSFREAGVLVGDRGTLTYQAITPTALSDQRISIYVAAFYDPGIIPIGGKIIVAPQSIVNTIASESRGDASLSTGLNVSFTNSQDAHAVKKEICENLKALHIDQFFSVEAYDEFDFTSELFQQLKSEKNLFSLISLIILTVACSNIISMLIILVHDKTKEIAIMRALGASKVSVGLIFGFSGFIMGSLGSLIGIAAACVTVHNLPTVLHLLGKLQGFDVLNARFYGETIPTEVSITTIYLVFFATSILSTCAGTIAAIKAARQNTAEALRAE